VQACLGRGGMRHSGYKCKKAIIKYLDLFLGILGHSMILYTKVTEGYYTP